jgi:hypothetical protein
MELLIDGDLSKPCSLCKKELPLKSFHKDKNNVKGFGRAYYCKGCANRKSRNYHREKMRNKDAEYQRKKRSAYIKNKHGITVDEYEERVRQQGGLCGICGESIEIDSHKTHLDHCHKTGNKRAMLCNNCNRALGYFKDDVFNLKRAVEYLDYYNKKFGLIKEGNGL